MKTTAPKGSVDEFGVRELPRTVHDLMAVPLEEVISLGQIKDCLGLIVNADKGAAPPGPSPDMTM